MATNIKAAIIMKEFLQNILNRIKSQGSAIVDISHLKACSWFHLKDNFATEKTIYIFRNSGELLISRNGDITKASWENIDHASHSLMLEIDNKAALFNIIYLTSEYLILQKDGTDYIDIFIKQQHYQAKIPANIASSSVELIFKDLNTFLNDANSHEKHITELGPTKSIALPTAGLTFNLEKEVSRVKTEVGESFSKADASEARIRLDYRDEIKKMKEGGLYLSSDDEVAFIIEMQDFEQELTEEGLLCPQCKSISNVVDGFCRECFRNNSYSRLI